MKILIVEDEKRVAFQLEKIIREILDAKIEKLEVCNNLYASQDYIKRNEIDLLFLDLNLKGLDGFELLKEIVAYAFHTIIVSAYKDKAITAFEYGVLDFVPKPFNRERLRKAISHFEERRQEANHFAKYLAIKKHGEIDLISVQKINYIKASDHYAEIHLVDGKKELHNKSLNALSLLLPPEFIRVHRSYIVKLEKIQKINRYEGSKYEIVLNDDTILPCSRQYYKEVLNRLL